MFSFVWRCDLSVSEHTQKTIGVHKSPFCVHSPSEPIVVEWWGKILRSYKINAKYRFYNDTDI